MLIKDKIFLLIKKIPGVVIYFFIMVIGIFAVCEIWFRFDSFLGNSTDKYSSIIVDKRLWYQWENKKNKDPLLPPFNVFSNTNINNLERLKYIAKEKSLPINTKLNSYDFLRPAEIKDQTTYSASINNLGFRDPARTIEKPKNVYRIIALGSYHTFGHGVDDKDTYPQQLEEILNNNRSDNLKIEVWNGGRQASTAIVGLAKLQTEIFKYKPDLLIWDYGFVDPYVVEDNNFPIIYLFTYKGLHPSIVWFFQSLKHLLIGNSIFFSKIVQFYAHMSYAKNVDNFMQVNKKMLEITKKQNISVIMLQQSIVGSNSKPYKKILQDYKHVTFINGLDIFNNYPVSDEVKKEFYSKSNWTAEFNPGLKKIKSWQATEYYIDIYHYNKWGFQAIAKYLANKINMLAKNDLPKNQQYKLQGE